MTRLRSAAFQEPEGDAIRCGLCPHHCRIREGGRGRCGVREVRDGCLVSLVWGRPVALAVDPVEKKPFYHFHPGASCLSLATVGCNLDCDYCQNHSLSRGRPGLERGPQVQPREVVEEALLRGVDILAYTYSEPTIFYEYAEDVSLAARERGLRNVFVTNGFIAEAPLRRLAPVMDAANVDLKCFSDETYRHHLGGRLQPVLDTLRRLVELEVWVEVTTLLVPGLNDGGEELDAVAGFLASLDPCIPWHVSRFHPDHRMTDRPRTSLETLERALDAGRRAGLRYVYPGNTPSHGGEHTCCHVCGEVLVEREGFSVRSCRIARGRCPGCLVALPGRFAR